MIKYINSVTFYYKRKFFFLFFFPNVIYLVSECHMHLVIEWNANVCVFVSAMAATLTNRIAHRTMMLNGMRIFRTERNIVHVLVPLSVRVTPEDPINSSSMPLAYDAATTVDVFPRWFAPPVGLCMCQTWRPAGECARAQWLVSNLNCYARTYMRMHTNRELWRTNTSPHTLHSLWHITHWRWWCGRCCR